jgi:predicted nucleic acid-binding protein
MARYFLDSSALVKHYHAESGSATVDAILRTPGDTFFISRLAVVELHSCFARLVREGVLLQQDFDKLILRLAADVSSGLLKVLAVSSHRLDGACSLLAAQGLSHAFRTLDAIHLASALACDARRGLAGLVAADSKLLTASTACGLSVLDVG